MNSTKQLDPAKYSNHLFTNKAYLSIISGKKYQEEKTDVKNNRNLTHK